MISFLEVHGHYRADKAAAGRCVLCINQAAEGDTVATEIIPDHLLHLVLTWADAGQLHAGGTWRDRSVYRRGVALSLAAQLAACTMNARGMIGPNLHITDAGSDLLAEWDALVAGEPEPVQPPVCAPSCLDDQQF